MQRCHPFFPFAASAGHAYIQTDRGFKLTCGVAPCLSGAVTDCISDSCSNLQNVQGHDLDAFCNTVGWTKHRGVAVLSGFDPAGLIYTINGDQVWRFLPIASRLVTSSTTDF